MQFVIVLLLLAAVAVFVTVPLRGRRGAFDPSAERVAAAARAVEDLEAAREAKYREIRDAELDHGTGKLSDADFGSLDAFLRAEAIGILEALDGARERAAAAETAPAEDA